MSGFRLAGLLRVRRLGEERAAVELAGARRIELVAAQRRRESQAALAGAGPGGPGAGGGSHGVAVPAGGAGLVGGAGFPGAAVELDPRAWQAAVAARAALSGLLTARREVEQAAGERVEVATTAWQQARREVRVVDKLAERHDAAERAAELHAEQVVLDEVAGRARPMGEGR